MVSSRHADLSEINVNIDNLLDVYNQTQKVHGVDTGLIEVGWDFDEDGHLHRLGDEAETQKTENKKEDNDRREYIMLGDIRCAKLGSFDNCRSPEIAENDDTNDCYICEYCSELGYKKEYKSYICDSCTACESCSEYDAEECSGCTYSSYRTGKSYKEEIQARGGSIALDPDEQIIIDAINDGTNYEPIRDSNSFTVLDYDHSYAR